MSSATIYLSGGIEKAQGNHASEWRKSCSQKLQELNYTPIDICAINDAYNNTHGHVYFSHDEANFLQHKENVRYQCIDTDLNLIINDSDAVICYFDECFRQGAGSFSEAQCAYDHDKPVFLVSEYCLADIPFWMKALTTKIFYNFSSLYDYLAQLPSNILKKDKYGNHSSGNHYLCSLCGGVYEKHKHSFVSTVKPLYCKSCVELVSTTREKHVDRYEFAKNWLKQNN